MISRRTILAGLGATALTATARNAAFAQDTKQLVIDAHGHFTTEPKSFLDWRLAQIAGLKDPSQKPSPASLKITDDQLREAVQPQLKFQRDRGTDVAIFSPRASGMGHHIGNAETSADWSRLCNELIYRITQLMPENFIGVGQLPQSPGVDPKNCIEELERCVKQYGFVGVNLNPDPSGGFWKDPPLTDRYWYPVYEKLSELDVPAMIHVSASANANFHATGAHYIAADTAAFMQFIQGDLFKDFPKLRVIIPHGGGAVPFHWGRYRGLAQDMKKPPLEEHLLKNVFFDTCVYHQAGIDMMFRVIPVENIIFASEMVGAVRGIDPQSGHHFDDTKKYIDKLNLSAEDRRKVLEGNARRVYGLDRTAFMKKRG
ncbi:amidohydrolase [Variibacter gotjawalensis]|uniref:Amidohydrolase n=1 Tax=Variibacter gotjawalensis TaxID=1333996 RepID=A0A0S3Q0J5_9BRAD|nr:amidohydrolase family protein [Variibacter gotjawalensis]NIK47558.1 4-oxalmesaconate hydratase [Variibacter gotjawalensis]RZS49455.1 4-oxalomesaconate hydratase [Variibacter gotjawalensis]BAT61718.1 amidohydrolase [Variibacter gotjawalensis]